jgi:hypothetical protein
MITRVAFAAVTALAAATLSLACASTPDDSFTPSVPVLGLDRASYEAMVHPVVERHCGSVDCHGKLPRGMRVYGESGLRLGTTVGKTTPAEAQATYVSIVGLQPEKTNELTVKSPRTSEDAYDLLLLAKPLTRERHRGGLSLRQGEPAEQCILSWLLGTIDTNACTSALPRP